MKFCLVTEESLSVLTELRSNSVFSEGARMGSFVDEEIVKSSLRPEYYKACQRVLMSLLF